MGLGVLAVSGVLAACGSSAGGHLAAPAGSPATTAAASTATAAAVPLTTAVPQVTDPSGQACPSLDSAGYCPGDDPATPMDNWCAGNGYSDYSAVESDLSALSADSGNNDLLSVESDGAQLFHHASVAGLNLPPVSDKTQKLDYGLYMGWLLVGGRNPPLGISPARTAPSRRRPRTRTRLSR